MSSPPPVRLALLDPAGNGLEVEFTWSNDRWQHKVYECEGGGRILLLESAHDVTEHAVALTEVHPQLASAPRPTLFLHGAGGGAQWSMSVEHGGEGELRFDVAARVLQLPLERTIGYQEAPDASGYALDIGPHTELRASTKLGEIELLSHAGESACPTTLRWRYSFRLARD